jgi:hypothetical protein
VAIQRDQLLVQLDCFTGGDLSLTPVARPGQVDSEGVDRPSQVRQVGLSSEFEKLPVQFDGFLGGAEPFAWPSSLSQSQGEVAHRNNEDEEAGVPVGAEQLPV